MKTQTAHPFQSQCIAFLYERTDCMFDPITQNSKPYFYF